MFFRELPLWINVYAYNTGGHMNLILGTVYLGSQKIIQAQLYGSFLLLVVVDGWLFHYRNYILHKKLYALEHLNWEIHHRNYKMEILIVTIRNS